MDTDDFLPPGAVDTGNRRFDAFLMMRADDEWGRVRAMIQAEAGRYGVTEEPDPPIAPPGFTAAERRALADGPVAMLLDALGDAACRWYSPLLQKRAGRWWVAHTIAVAYPELWTHAAGRVACLGLLVPTVGPQHPLRHAAYNVARAMAARFDARLAQPAPPGPTPASPQAARGGRQ